MPTEGSRAPPSSAQEAPRATGSRVLAGAVAVAAVVAPFGGATTGAAAAAAATEAVQRPSTAPVSRPSPLRTSAIALTSLHTSGGGTSDAVRAARPATPNRPVIALDSPRLRQLLGQNFAAAVPAKPGSSIGAAGTPRSPAGPQGSLRQQWQQPRPGTPSFQPLSTSPTRPATALAATVTAGDAATAGSSLAASGSGEYSIKAFHHTRTDSNHTPRGGPLGAYPVPPATAPAKTVVAGVLRIGADGDGSQQQRELAAPKSGFVAYGINPAAFIAAAGRRGGAAAATLPPPQPPLLAVLLASAGLAGEVALRAFLLEPGPVDRGVQCRILRTRGGLLKGATQYRLVLDEAGGGSASGRVLLAARKHASAGGGARYTLFASQASLRSLAGAGQGVAPGRRQLAGWIKGGGEVVWGCCQAAASAAVPAPE